MKYQNFDLTICITYSDSGNWSPWLSAHRTSSGEWFWANGQPVNDTWWSPGEPDGYGDAVWLKGYADNGLHNWWDTGVFHTLCQIQCKYNVHVLQ